MNLVKGEAMDLTKDNPGLNEVAIGGGWDLSQGAEAFDLDLFAIPTDATGKFVGDHNKDIAYYNNMTCNGMALDKDNRTGEGDGDDETMSIKLSAVPSQFEKVYVGINIYEGAAKGQRFGQVENSFIRLYDKTKGPASPELARYELRGDFKKYTAVVMGCFYRAKGTEWEFEAIGKGTNGNIKEIADSLPTIHQ